ncbi:hypothetical protein [Psychrobacter lutiphocae]|nr:hypothetical protein [Psychrobacter lutiphocae]
MLTRVKQLQSVEIMMAHGEVRFIEPEVFDALIAKVPKVPVTV